MPKEEVYDLHPYGWENDPEVERSRVSTLDYLTVLSYNHYAIFFRLEDAEKPRVVETLKAGLEKTLAQPITSAFKANFVRGGLVFSIHSHHYAADVMGWAGFVHQFAENCYAFAKGTAYPTWDPACQDVSRLLKPEPPRRKRWTALSRPTGIPITSAPLHTSSTSPKAKLRV
ncbi:acyl transferase [Colletotrichum tofieldiae]|nr:acyl transferase [Colletotrichum tofieldiae]